MSAVTTFKNELENILGSKHSETRITNVYDEKLNHICNLDTLPTWEYTDEEADELFAKAEAEGKYFQLDNNTEWGFNAAMSLMISPVKSLIPSNEDVFRVPVIL